MDMIRKARPEDMERMLEMGRHFFEASGYSDVTDFDHESFVATLKHLMGRGVLLVADKGGVVGFVGALVFPFYFNRTHQSAQEMFWWVEPEHRGIGSELFDAMVAEVKALGGQSLSMIALETLDPEKVGVFYEKRGFRPSERMYVRTL